MNIIFQGRFPVRTIVLIGVALLITTQIYAQNAEARLSLTLRNATLKEFVKRIENYQRICHGWNVFRDVDWNQYH